MRYVIIENEYFALENLRKLMNQIQPQGELVFSAESVRECIAFFSENPAVDLVFMDIELVDGNCFQVLEQTEIRCPVIFTTAYDHFALEAFRLDTVDYLLKPISEAPLHRAIEKFQRRQIAVPDESMMAHLSKVFPTKTQWSSRILVSDGDGYSFVNIDDINFFFAEDKYVLLMDSNGHERITFFPSLAKVEEEVNPARFFRVNRKILASIDSVQKVSRFPGGRLRVQLKSGSHTRNELISPVRRTAFLDWLGTS